MSYQVVLTATASKEYKHLDPPVRPRVGSVLRHLGQIPRPVGATKLSGHENDWRVRVGEYRVLYEVNDHQRRITVWRIAHRGRAYR